MNTNAGKRLLKDLKKIKNEQREDIAASPEKDNILRWTAVIFGPKDTPWEDGVFRLEMDFSEEYPHKAPTVKFVTSVFHPNVYNNGNICIDILNNNWSAAYDVSAILTSIQSLLTDPNPASAANAEAAKLYTDNLPEYQRRVRQCVEDSWDADES